MSILKNLIYSNFWIALCAFCATLQSYWLFGLPPEWPVLGLLFASTFARYNILTLIIKENNGVGKFSYMWRHRNGLRVLFFVACLASAFFTFFLGLDELVFLAHLALLTVWYIFPLPLGFAKIPPLRRVPYLKIFLIAYVWTCGTYLLPAFELDWAYNWQIWGGFTERYLFLFAITLPFDIRDLEEDRKTGVSTIPTEVGVKAATFLAVICLLIASAIHFIFFDTSLSMALIAGYLFSAVAVLYSSPKHSDLFYLGTIDGTMVMQFLLVMGADFLG